MNYSDESDSMGVLVRLLGGMNGIVDNPSIKPGFDIVLDEILLELEIKREVSSKSLNFFQNIYKLLR